MEAPFGDIATPLDKKDETKTVPRARPSGDRLEPYPGRLEPRLSAERDTQCHSSRGGAQSIIAAFVRRGFAMTARHAPHLWRPLTGMPDGAETWGNPAYGAMADEWHGICEKLTATDRERAFLEAWLLERRRAFAIETGQIEGLYTLRRGITEQLITEGFEGARSAHTVEDVDDRTLMGLLNDQQAALEMVFADVAGGRPLSGYTVRSWHQLLTRHQETVIGLTPFGHTVQVPFERKGLWKIRPNNPRRPDGVVHEYCPPEIVAEEMERFFELYEDIREQNYPVEAEAAWLHHRFVRTHPFQDGNGRVSRLLMAYPYLKQGLPPPLVLAAEKPAYIAVLEEAVAGDLRGFSDHIGDRAQIALRGSLQIGRNALRGELERPNGNGGRTVGNRYYPPQSKGRSR